MGNSAFPSIFQKIWDQFLKEKNIMVILCGSLITMMESQTLNYTSPLYGRRTGQIKLKQIPFRYYHEFFPEKSQIELIEYFAVTGGVPKYIEMFQEGKDIYLAIDNNILSRQNFLYDEPNFLLQREVTEVGSYFSIIRAIAGGNRKLSKIAATLEVKQTGLTKYLKTLMDLDIVAYDNSGEDIFFGECKFWKNKVGINILTELEDKAKLVDWKREKSRKHYIIFSINGYTDEMIEVEKNRKDVFLG